MNAPTTDFLNTDEREELARRISKHFILELKDEKNVEEIVEVWGRHLDRHIGRSVRRVLWLFVIAVTMVLSLKFDAIVAWFRH